MRMGSERSQVNIVIVGVYVTDQLAKSYLRLSLFLIVVLNNMISR